MESKSTGWHLAVTVLISGFYLDRNYNLFICRYCVTFNMWKFLSIMLVFNMGIAFLISDWFSLSINPEMTSDGFRHFYQPLQTCKIPIHPVNNILILFFRHIWWASLCWPAWIPFHIFTASKFFINPLLKTLLLTPIYSIFMLVLVLVWAMSCISSLSRLYLVFIYFYATRVYCITTPLIVS